jgi:hypothetical protein
MIDQVSYSTIVAGGGIAGIAAAVSSARLGAKTLLVERYGFLGGLATAGLVNPFMTHRTSTGRPLIAGIFDELCSRLDSLGGMRGGTFDSEAMKFAAQEMVLEAGADLLLHTWISGAIMDGRTIRGVRVVNKSGERDYPGSMVVDATGDGDVAVAAGAQYEMGGADGMPQSMTLMIDVGGVDFARVMDYVRQHPDQMRFPKIPSDADPEKLAKDIISVAGYYDLVTQARERGEYPIPGDLIFFVSRPRPGEVVFNTTHIGGVKGTSAEDLTRAEIEGRRQAAALVEFARKYVPGFENAYLLRTAAQVGVRETRRITGEYVFSAQDVAKAQKFDDAIARLAYPVDVHSGKGDGYTREEEEEPSGPLVPPPGDWYEIPYRCLVPLEIENLLIAGRCVSSTQAGHGAIRIIPCCAAMGQAAGTAAALSIRENVSPRGLDTDHLVRELREQGSLI